MTTNGHQSDLAASSIDVEPTERQRAAYDLASALNRPGAPDWAAVTDAFSALTGVEDSGDFTLESAKRAAARIYEGLLSGQEPLPAQYEAVSLALEQSRKARPIEVTDGIPEHYWQGWLIEGWLASGCVGMLTGDGGVGKSRSSRGHSVAGLPAVASECSPATAALGSRDLPCSSRGHSVAVVSGWAKADRCRHQVRITGWALSRCNPATSSTRLGKTARHRFAAVSTGWKKLAGQAPVRILKLPICAGTDISGPHHIDTVCQDSQQPERAYG